VLSRVTDAARRIARLCSRADSADAEFQFTDILTAIRHHRHLQVIVAIITVTFIVDVTIDYQFNAMAKLAYRDKDQLTAFLGNFYGVYLNLINFFLQFFLTAAVVRWFGVGGTLQIMPVTISATALATFFLPGVKSSAALRLTEAATRYTLNRTGMELLYVPLPADLKNRTKAFVDIFVDRMGRGLGGVILIFCTSVLSLTPKTDTADNGRILARVDCACGQSQPRVCCYGAPAPFVATARYGEFARERNGSRYASIAGTNGRQRESATGGVRPWPACRSAWIQFTAAARKAVGEPGR
jgi:ATP/ADP translocase